MGGGGNSNLSINVLATPPDTKGLVTDTYLPASSEIGVTVTNTSGGNYDGTAYNNIKFTSSGTSTSQTWSGASTVKLSATDGYCYAYYPYSSSASTITEIPVTAGGTDYLYATKVTVNDKAKTATLNMKHALSAIRFALKKGTYGGTGKVTAVSVTSSALGSSGTLNATTGAVTAANKGTAVSQTANLTLSTTAQNVDVVMVPSGTAGTITLTVTIDGKAYSTSVSSTTIAQGNCYTYTLTVNAGALALSGVKVGDWGYNDSGTPTISAAGYTVTFAGNYTDVLFTNSVNENTISIEAIHKSGCPLATVTKTGTATLSQSIVGNVTKITLADIETDVIVTFNGCAALPAAIADDWSALGTGVYLVRPDLKPANVVKGAKGNNLCIGVGLIYGVKRFMIEKFEDNNASYQQTYTDFGSTSSNIMYFSWGYQGKVISELLNINSAFYPIYNASAQNMSSICYIPNKDYVYSYRGNESIYKGGLGWASNSSNAYALDDKDGYQHSKWLMQVTEDDGYTKYPKMGQLLKTFLSSNDALGYTDWYIPACGQLGYFYCYLTEINAAMSVIGGKVISTSNNYWSSTQQNYKYGWKLDFDDGYVWNSEKYGAGRVRFIRDLN